MSFRLDEISLETSRELPCAQQLLINTAFGFVYSLAGSVVIFTLRAPSSRAKVQPLFKTLAMDIVPVLTVSSALFTVTQCTLDGIREKRDMTSTAVASAAVGALVAGVKYRTIVGAAVGAGLFAIVGTAPEMAAMLSGDPIELQKRDYDPRPFIHTARGLAGSADVSARLVGSHATAPPANEGGGIRLQ